MAYTCAMPIRLESLNLHEAERLLCQSALERAGTLGEAARLLGISRHELDRRMTKHGLQAPPEVTPDAPAGRDE